MFSYYASKPINRPIIAHMEDKGFNRKLTTAPKDYKIIEHFISTRRSRLAWSRAHDWKSCKPQKGFEGSNPSFSAKRDS